MPTLRPSPPITSRIARLIVEFGKGMTGGRSRGGSGGSRRVGGSRSGPAAPCEPVDEGRRAVLACTAAIGKRGVTRTQMSHLPPSSRPSSERLARNLMGAARRIGTEGETSAVGPHSIKKRLRGLRRWCTVTFCGKINGDGGSACICKKSLTESISDLNLWASMPLRPNAAPAGEMRFGICGGQSPAEKAE